MFVLGHASVRQNAGTVLSSDHPDKATYPTRTFNITAATLPDVLLGEVVWVGRAMGTARRR